MLRVRRALISVSDKRGVVDFARFLQGRDIEIVSTGGTAAALRDAGLTVIDVSSKTGFPEIMNGRVKTLHPTIHGGLLGRRGTDDAVMAEFGIEPIDLLVVNLYPFEQTVKNPDSSVDDAIENIDIGGPAMIRAAAKNHASVATIVDPDDYAAIGAAITDDGVSESQLRTLAAKAFTHTAAYDATIANWFDRELGTRATGDPFVYAGRRIAKLRYGENPHQSAAFYRDSGDNSGTLAAARQLSGKTLSYNNIADSDASLECLRQFDAPACVIVKHANPCGVAVDADVLSAYERAYRTDPTSAFGGIIAINRALDAATATSILERQFVEVLIAPEIDRGALAALGKKKNVRVLATGPLGNPLNRRVEVKTVTGGMLVQSRDDGAIAAEDLQLVSDRRPDENELSDLMFAWRVVKYVKSNGIVFCRDNATVGIGAGQMSRVYSTKLAALKAADEGLEIAESVMASDAFFPFRDGIDSAAKFGIRAVIQPGGSMRDDEVIRAANEHGLAMVFTGMRHFRH